jgi:hypothetical protein
LLMYADDGLVFRDNKDEDFNLNNRKWGIKVNEEKNLGWTTNFKFLGITYDTVKMTASLDGVQVGLFDDDGIKSLLKYSKYTEKQGVNRNVIHYGNSWAWKTVDSAMITKVDIQPGNTAVVGETGTFNVDPFTVKTDINNLVWDIIQGLKLWHKPQRVRIDSSSAEAAEGNKLFNIQVKIGKNQTLQQTVR